MVILHRPGPHHTDADLLSRQPDALTSLVKVPVICLAVVVTIVLMNNGADLKSC